MLRQIAAVFWGVIAGGSLISIGERLSYRVFGYPAEIDPDSLDQSKADYSSIPDNVFLILILVWALSSFGGGLVAAFIATKAKKKVAMIVGGILLLVSLSNYMFLPHPMWVVVSSLVLYIPMAYLGASLIDRKKE